MIVHAEDPQRAAAALAVLLAAPARKWAGNGWTVGGAVHVFPGRPDIPSDAGIARLLLETAHPVEGVMEVACAHGFHAEELGRTGVVEFWIGEAMLVELVTSDASARFDLAAWRLFRLRNVALGTRLIVPEQKRAGFTAFSERLAVAVDK